MLFLIFVSEYLFGEILFTTLDGQYNGIDLNVVYYLSISILDAVVCSYTIKQDGIRYKVYAVVSIALCFFHIYGLYVYWYAIDYNFYQTILMYALVFKFIISVAPDGTNRDNFLSYIGNDLVYRCYAAYISRFYRQDV